MLIECIPNVSEGRDIRLIEELQSVITSSCGVNLLHTDIGHDTNRTVFTFIGSCSGVFEAAIKLYERALERININLHRGAHPRIGAVDVSPFVALRDASLEDANRVAVEVGAEIAARFGIPVYLYESSAKAEYRRKLSDIRKGELAGLAQRMQTKEWVADFGPSVLHPTFGATAIGARRLLVAFNVSLNTLDLSIARTIAREIREKRMDPDPAVCSKWAGVRALGWEIKAYGCTQVSTNIYDTSSVSLYDVYTEVQNIAARYGVEVVGSELIGVISEEALRWAGKKFGAKTGNELEVAIEKLGLNLHLPFVIEERVLEKISHLAQTPG